MSKMRPSCAVAASTCPGCPSSRHSAVTQAATIFTATTEGNGYQIAVASIEFPDRLTSAQVKAALDAAFEDRISIAGGKVEGVMFPATLLEGVKRDSDLYRKEAFGPVAVVHRVTDEDEAVALANDSP